MSKKDEKIKIFRASHVIDAEACDFSPGAVAVQGYQILAVGDPAEVDREVKAQGDTKIEQIDYEDHTLLPGLVNAHCHLDLTRIGPRRFTGDFLEWIKMVIAERPRTVEAVAASVRRGATMSRSAGTLTIGDISGLPDVDRLAYRENLRGVVFAELLGMQATTAEVTGKIQQITADSEQSSLKQSLQPHAPYSTSPATYRASDRWSMTNGLTVSTHLSETREEARMTGEAGGPFRDLLDSLNKWPPAEGDAHCYEAKRDPIDWLDRLLEEQGGRWLLAHVNYVENEQIHRLALRGWAVAYCPRASAYFGHRDHRYREMLEAGIPVGLGTDAIICHDSLSIWDEMRFLHDRDGLAAETLMAMGTSLGAVSLGMPRSAALLSPGSEPGLIAVKGRSFTEALQFSGQPVVLVEAGAWS